jgi:hypothetical protein
MKLIVVFFLIASTISLGQSSGLKYGFTLSPNYSNGLLVDDFEFTVWNFDDILETVEDGGIALNKIFFIEKKVNTKYSFIVGFGVSNIKHRRLWSEKDLTQSKVVMVQKIKYVEIPFLIKNRLKKKVFLQYGISFLFSYFSSLKVKEFNHSGNLVSKVKSNKIFIGSKQVNLNLSYGYNVYEHSKFKVNLKINSAFGIFTFKKLFSDITDNTINLGFGAEMIF